MSNQKAIIIKKVKKTVGGGHHGGNWKVAYADFVTAMMAFFLLMWLLNMSSPEKRVRLSYYFKHFSLFTQGGTSFMAKSSEIFSESGETSQKVFMDDPADKKKVKNEDGDITIAGSIKKSGSAVYPEGIEKALKQAIMDKLGDIKDQVLVDTVEDGVRIQMIDKDGSEMFELGSNRLSPKAKEVLHVIGENINELPNKVIIEGHTDSLPFARSEYSNWELSTERASSARKELEVNGLNPDRIMRVAGYADKDLLIKEDPADPRNRRISIILKIPLKKEEGKTTKKNMDLSLLKNDKKKAKLPALIISGKKPVVKRIEKEDVITKKDVPAENREESNPVAGGKWSPVTDKDKDKPVINNIWEPVINRGMKDPAIKNEWGPILNMGKNNISVKSHDWNPLPERIERKPAVKKPAAKKTVTKPVIDIPVVKRALKKLSEDNSTIKKTVTTPVINKTVEKRGTKKTFTKKMKKLSVIMKENNYDIRKDAEADSSTNDRLNPVVKNDKWSPVIKKDAWSPVLNQD